MKKNFPTIGLVILAVIFTGLLGYFAWLRQPSTADGLNEYHLELGPSTPPVFLTEENVTVGFAKYVPACGGRLEIDLEAEELPECAQRGIFGIDERVDGVRYSFVECRRVGEERYCNSMIELGKGETKTVSSSRGGSTRQYQVTLEGVSRERVALVTVKRIAD